MSRNASIYALFALFVLLLAAVVTEVKAWDSRTNTTFDQSWDEVDINSKDDSDDDDSDDDSDDVVSMVDSSIKNRTATMKAGSMSSCRTGNPIDDCWRCDPNWHKNRQKLADCAIGFGRKALGGRSGKIYIVTDPSDDPVNPRPGTLRYGVVQKEPLWIIFKNDMNLKLKQELIVNSFKTIDGRGVEVHIANGGCITIYDVTNVIIHGLNIHHCKVTGNAKIRDSANHVERRGRADGDAVHIQASSHIWIDHNSLSRCDDGLIDVVHGSTAVTISNNYMTNHDKVMLLGHSDSFTQDKKMQVTVAYNHFGEGLIQRMPRVRHGFVHVLNNDYTHWGAYAIGGSANPTIYSQGNRFLASGSKQVTKIINNKGQAGNWRSQGDLFLNGAYFKQVGTQSPAVYSRASSMAAKSAKLVGSMTSGAGALSCRVGGKCAA